MVKFAAFVVDPHYSNVSKGQTVNCKLRGKDQNDIHIVLGRASTADLCDSVTAEMSPHFRPVAWEQITETTLRHPVRITGKLFFDASHSNPQRISLWEIHPAYAIDVCRSATLVARDANDDSVWTPLDEWLATEAE